MLTSLGSHSRNRLISIYILKTLIVGLLSIFSPYLDQVCCRVFRATRAKRPARYEYEEAR